MKTSLAFLVGVIIGLVAAFTVQGLPGGGGPPSPSPGFPPSPSPSPLPSPLPSPTCEALVKLSLQGATIVADPDRVCLAIGRPLTWEIDGAGEVEIDFETKNNKKGPFAHDPQNNPHNKIERGKYKREKTDNSKRISANTADVLASWKYTVKWTPPGEPTREIDPVVCIRK
jgi:hypothetical protein